MFLADYHTHSDISSDGRADIPLMLRWAEKAGMTELAVTDHFDSDKPFDMPLWDKNLRDAAESNRSGVKLLRGVELGEGMLNEPQTEELLSGYELDFVLGSYHGIVTNGEFKDFYYVKCQNEDECHEHLELYFDQLYDFACWGRFDVLGHITYPLRYMTGRNGYRLDIARYEPKLRRVFGALIKRGIGIELNVSGFREKWYETMPPLSVLMLYKACGGEMITIGSDSHVAEHIGLFIRQGTEVIKSAGFTHIAAFSERKVRYERL